MLSLPTEPAFARTYEHTKYTDPYEAVLDFHTYDREYRDTELGSSAVSTRMTVPRGRIQSWERGHRPDPVSGLETAREHGWLNCPVDGEIFSALNRLVAGIYSGGSIDAEYSPAFSASDDRVAQQIRDDLETLGAGCQLIESNSQQHDDLRPTNDAAILGRVLVSLGAPKGPKTESVSRLPTYLEWVDPNLRREFVQVYLSNRAVNRKNDTAIEISERRPREYLASLAALIQAVSGVDASASEQSIRIHEDVLPMLGLEQ